MALSVASSGIIPATRSSGSSTPRPIGIDLFSGVGGLSLGFEQAGFDVVASAEYDPVHAAVHAFNFPHTEIICDDVSRIEPTRLLQAAHRGFLAHGREPNSWTGEVDVIFGGPPCQGFSTMGKRELADERNCLVYAFADLIAALRPRYFVMENVPGLASGEHATILTRLISRFRRCGFNIAEPYRILNAADFGVPQDRRRLFLLGTRRNENLAQYPASSVRPAAKRSSVKERESIGIFPPGPTVGGAILDLPDLDNYDVLLKTDEVRLTERDVRRFLTTASPYALRLRGEIDDLHDLSYPRAWERLLLTSSMRTVHTPESIRRFEATNCGETEAISRLYRLDPRGLSNTLRAGTGGERGAYTSPRPIHPTLPRVLSVREAARLHSFPDWFRFHRTKWHGFRSIGNAVPPLLGRAIAGCIAVALGASPSRPRESMPLGDTDLLSIGRLTAAARFSADLRRIPKSRMRAPSNA
jgi:DNA (cytosine-5)-methyltransferase 1